MVGQSRVPNNFNTMGSSEIENLFLNDRRDWGSYEVPTPKKQHSPSQIGEPFDKMYVILEND